ncbi:AsmA-like C-terminal region-containing protein [Flammeovirgaceae bacterium SG7u.111]|nr:AsmA-like C-terminal region-containing protein [Flammeovirgaceae bacterium SG7u.132]WPO38171.1 AsmA-like C-terminal region-containing protein [Flammeovirgaceae bacterium SG7u.111]
MKEDFSLKRILLYVFLVSTVMGVALFSFAYKYKNQIAGKIIEEFGENTGLAIKLGRSSISVFKTYPNVTLELSNILVKSRTHGDTLANLDKIILSFDYEDIKAGNYDVKYVLVDGGYARLLRRDDGTANYRVNVRKNLKDTTSLNLNLQEISIKNTAVVYTNKLNNTNYEGLARDIRMKLGYNKEIMSLDIDGNVFLHEATLDSNTFLRDKSVTLNGKLTYDILLNELAINPSQVKLEGTSMEMEGFLDFANDKNLDLDIRSEETVFKNLLALAPSDNSSQLGNYSAKGMVFVNAKLKGKISKGKNPNVTIDFGCVNTTIRRIDKNVSMDSLNLIGHYSNGSEQSLATSELTITGMNFRMGNQLVDGFFKMKNFDEPSFETKLKGEVDVERLLSFAAPAKIHRASGSVVLDVDIRGEIRDIAKAKDQKNGFYAKGFIRFKGVDLGLKSYKPVLENLRGTTYFKNDWVNFSSLKAKVGESELVFSGKLKQKNRGGLFSGNSTFEGRLVSKELHVSELMGTDGEMAKKALWDVDCDFKWDIFPTNPMVLHLVDSGAIHLKQLAFRTAKAKPKMQGTGVGIEIGNGDMNMPSIVLSGGESSLNGAVSIKRFASWWKRSSQRCRVDFNITTNSLQVNDFTKVENRVKIDNLRMRGYIFARLQDLRSLETIPYTKLQIQNCEFDLRQWEQKLESVRADFRVSGRGVVFREVSGVFGQQRFFIKGGMENYEALLKNTKEPAQVTVFYKSPKLNVTKLINNISDSKLSKLSPSLKNKLDIRHLNVQVAELAYEQIELNDFFAKGSFQSLQNLVIDSSYAKAGDGYMQLKGNYSLADSILNTEMEAKGVEVSKFFQVFKKMGKGLVLEKNVKGKGDFSIIAKAKVAEPSSIDFQQTSANVKAVVVNGEINQYLPLRVLGDYFENSKIKTLRFDSLYNEIEVKSDSLIMRSLQLKTANGDVFVSGNQVSKRELDYKVTIDARILDKIPYELASELPQEYRSLLVRRSKNDPFNYFKKDSRAMLSIRLLGTPQLYEVSFMPDFNLPESEISLTKGQIVQGDSLKRVSMNR